MSTIDLNSLGNPTNAKILVFTKATWADAFAYAPNLIVEEIVWAVAPQVSVASLQWRYGDSVFAPGATAAAAVPKVTARGYYVLIMQQTGASEWLSWLGYADSAVIIQEDSASGVQRIPCFGFDRALQYSMITSTVHVDPGDATKWKRKDRGAVFNAHTKGNRTSAKVKVNDADPTPTVYAFENPSVDSREWWSSQDIVQHLATFHLPTMTEIPGTIPWSIVGFDRLPDWDHPKLETDEKSIFTCLSEIASIEQLLGWRVMPTISGTDPLVTPPTVTAVNIEFFTHASAAVVLPGVTNLPANHDIQVWTHSSDRLTDSSIDEDDADTVDQVIVRGPREVAVGTFRYSDEWINGWTPAELTEYNETYSGQGFWASASAAEKREWNQFFRSLTKYQDVYRNFPIRDDWDGELNGESLFWKSDPGDDAYIPYLGNTYFMDRLPLFRGIDYSGSVASVDESRGRHTLPILAYIETPDDPTKYWQLQTIFTDIGASRVKHPNSLDFDISVGPYFDRGPGFTIDVQGAPQHAHRPSFTGNDGDPEKTNPKMWGEIDSETMLITAAMVGDRRPEVRLPASVSADFVRRKYITFEHPGLQHIEISPGCVVGHDRFGVLETSDGGTLRDPFEMLTALATLAGERFLSARKVAKIRTGRQLNIQTGAMIGSINGTTVNAVINEVRVSTPVVESESPPSYSMHITAVDNDLDVVALVARVPVPEAVR
ncbi:hypothetical protein Mal15_21930 [Stieleria maiorica]|uniref:Uncharacterized protein n=1 Tax=Stieleria maiorica TaxID=2795974 RepID=A0A5B9MF34_9BACT|nr:hypothetical protein [Stieleria maiorica]QEF98145.1 hypothetical protein Mal15_21930 [Stieleria maiorica]